MFLAVDTVFEQCSVAIVRPDLTVLSCHTQTGKREQTQQILPMIDTALKQAGIMLGDLTALIFNRGPGPFSGIRINTAVVQALAVAQDIPCVGVSSLAAIAQLAYDDHGFEHVYAALDARMNQVYFGEFIYRSGIMVDAKQCECKQDNVDSEKLVDYEAKTAQSIPIVGNGAILLSAHSNQPIVFENMQPDAECLAKLGIHQFFETGGVPAEQALPIYLRNHAWKTLKEQGK